MNGIVKLTAVKGGQVKITLSRGLTDDYFIITNAVTAVNNNRILSELARDDADDSADNAYTSEEICALARSACEDLSPQGYTGTLELADIKTKGPWVDVRTFGAKGDGVTDDTAAIQAAIDSVPLSGGTVFLPPGIFRGYIAIRRSNLNIVGSGIAATTLKLPDGATITTSTNFSGAPTVVEAGAVDFAWPPVAYENVHVSNMTVDGNASGTTDPAGTDLIGWGVATTAASNCTFRNLKIINTWQGGVGHFINSNNCFFENIFIKNCGYTTYGGSGQHGFDINSCDYTFAKNIIVENCKYGARVLDNCIGTKLEVVVINAVNGGLSYAGGAYQGNKANGNHITATIVGGCAFFGVGIGDGCYASTVDCIVDSVTNMGFIASSVASTANYSTGNSFNIKTRNCGGASAIIYQDNNNFTISSYKDCRNAGGFAVQVYGSNNVIDDLSVIDVGTPTVRGLQIMSGASDNRIKSIQFKNLLQNYSTTSGTRTMIDRSGYSESISNATGVLSLPVNGLIVPVTGGTGVTGIFTEGCDGRIVTLFALDGFVLYHGGGTLANIFLSGGVSYTLPAGRTITLMCTGSNWIEAARG